MSTRLIIFDLDGTLVDTVKDITNSLNHAIKPYGIKELSVHDTVKLVGEGITRLIEKVIGEENYGCKEDVIKRFLEYYTEHLTEYSTSYPHVMGTLEKLHGYKKAVISNKSEALSRALLEKLGLLKYIDLVVGGDTVSEKKPSPLPVIHVLENLRIASSEAIMVGDSPYDIEAGRKAGVKTVAVTYGYRERDLLDKADYMIDGLKQLIPFLYEEELMLERRREKRYPVPEIYRKYIEMKIRKVSGDLIDVGLLDFSEHGIRIKSPVRFFVGELIDCIASIPQSLTRDVTFKAIIRHWVVAGDGFIIGAEIKEVQDAVWFRIFKRVHDFISEKEYFHEEGE
ncbi:MAG: HAD-IA family hydrolase [Nitrospirae bacterium]|nr:HAD-IA family hydrolase [Nitrospirota bacterium]